MKYLNINRSLTCENPRHSKLFLMPVVLGLFLFGMPSCEDEPDGQDNLDLSGTDESDDTPGTDADTDVESDIHNDTATITDSDTPADENTDETVDLCPDDPNKTKPGICGCAESDADSDGDGVADCEDNCPRDPNKAEPGQCGCGAKEGSCNADNRAQWTFLVFMNGDNNLEHLVTKDLNELEVVGSSEKVNVVVQADRIKGYSTDDGDWTNTRRYYITRDNDTKRVSSKVVEDLPELDMGDPNVLSDFLVWAHNKYPADRIALSLWDHGDSWRSSFKPTARTVSDDETSNSSLSIAEGELSAALKKIVSIRGPLDLIAFDACLMASWEVAHSLQGYALNMAASEALMYDEGLMYDDALTFLTNRPNADGAALADRMARSTVNLGKESTYSATNLTAMEDLTTAIDHLADAVLQNPALKQPLLNARNNSRGADAEWKNWYLDIFDFASQLAQSNNAVLQSSGRAIQHGMDSAVIGAYGRAPYAWAGGLTIWFDTKESASYLNKYAQGTWSQDTSWDELMKLLTKD